MKILKFLIASTFVLALSSCKTGGGSVVTVPNAPSGPAVGGTVTAPLGVDLGRSASRSSTATGLAPAAGAAVRAYLINDDGEAIGGALSSAVASSSGVYSLSLPPGYKASSNLVVSTGSGANRMRAIVTSNASAVDINPMTELIVRRIAASSQPLSNFSVSEIGAIRTKATQDAVAINLSAAQTVEEAVAMLYSGELFINLNANIAIASGPNGTPVCGNGTIDEGETCDDGNSVSGDGCSNLCEAESVSASCGNGQIEGTESCDDGNRVSGDGCNQVCGREDSDYSRSGVYSWTSMEKGSCGGDSFIDSDSGAIKANEFSNGAFSIISSSGRALTGTIGQDGSFVVSGSFRDTDNLGFPCTRAVSATITGIVHGQNISFVETRNGAPISGSCAAACEMERATGAKISGAADFNGAWVRGRTIIQSSGDCPILKAENISVSSSESVVQEGSVATFADLTSGDESFSATVANLSISGSEQGQTTENGCNLSTAVSINLASSSDFTWMTGTITSTITAAGACDDPDDQYDFVGTCTYVERQTVFRLLDSVCGNQIVEDGEQCDDGNVVSLDGCSSTCQADAMCSNDSDCSDGDAGTRDLCFKAATTDAYCVNNPAASVATGFNHSCALTAEGGVKCWGENMVGELGRGTRDSSSTPVNVIGVANAASVAAGSYHTCALLSDSAVRCWGWNKYGQLGDGTTTTASTPVNVTGLANAVSVSAGYYSACAALIDGGVKCWGRNDAGQLGDGTTTDSLLPINANNIENAASVSVGDAFACALLSSGGVKCWGKNDAGQLGDGTTADSSTPVGVTGITDASSVSAGKTHACAILSGGGVKCWGENASGELGDGTTESSSTPVHVPGIASVAAVSAGASYTCVVLSNGGAKCWGYNSDGQLGDGSMNDSTDPVRAAGLTTATYVSAQNTTTCAGLADGGVKCWGYNGFGNLGDGKTVIQTTFPANVTGVGAASSVSAGIYHTCAALKDGRLQCWGKRSLDLSYDSLRPDLYVPVDVSGVSGAISVSAGESSTCALLSDGGVQCWGSNIDLTGIENAVSISAGAVGDHNCVVLSDGGLTCWGGNSYGQLGDGTTVSPSTPVNVVGIANAASVAVGGHHTCAVLSDGAVRCWGGNEYGQLGDGTTVSASTPVNVADLSNAVSISAGYYSTCAALMDGGVKCWGWNKEGAAGGEGAVNDLTPASVADIENAAAVSSEGWSHTCALLLDGGVKCWGGNANGQLGDGTRNDSIVPVNVIGIANATSVSLGDGHSCAALSDGGVKCWGTNGYGRLGQYWYFNSATPISVVGF